MTSKTFSVFASIVLLLLATTWLLTGCSPTTTTLTAATDERVASGVCAVWLPVTYSSRDTDQTQLEARANNAARDAYCGGP